MPNPQVTISEQTREHYGVPLAHVLPDLQGYDQLYILSEADFPAKNKDLPASFGYQVLHNAPFLQQLRQSNPELAEQLEDHISQSIFSSTGRERSGPSAIPLSFDTPEGPKRVGLIFVTKDYETLQYQAEEVGLPRTVHSDGGGFASNPRKQQEEDWLTFSHETGHLVHSTKTGIYVPYPSTLSWTHESETAADDYRQDIHARMQAAGELQYPELNESFSNLRTMSGVDRAMQGKFNSHYTEPFKSGGVLEDTTTARAQQAAIALGQSIDADMMTRFSEYYRRDGSTSQPAPSSPQDAAQTQCVAGAIDQRYQRQSAGFIPSLLDTALDCMKATVEARNYLMGRAVEKFPADSVEARMGQDYQRAGEEELRRQAPAPAAPGTMKP